MPECDPDEGDRTDGAEHLRRPFRFVFFEIRVRALDAILDPVSLFEPVFHDGTDTVCVMDQVGDTRNTDDHWLAAIALREAIDGLDDREKRIIRLRFFEGRTQMEVAREIHLSPNKRKQEKGQKAGKTAAVTA